VEEVLVHKYLLATLLILVFPLSLWGQTPAFDPNRSIALVFSSSVSGEIEPCG
jgi:hypothetical protein